MHHPTYRIAHTTAFVTWDIIISLSYTRNCDLETVTGPDWDIITPLLYTRNCDLDTVTGPDWDIITPLH